MQRADRGVGPRLGRPDRPAVAGRRGARAARGPAGVRPGLLPVPRQHARQGRRSTRTTTRPFVFTNDFAALRPDTSDAVVEAGLFRAEGDAGHLPGRLLLAAPRPDPRRDGDRRRSATSSTSGRTQTTELGAAVPVGPGVREPRRGDGRLEPAPARPDLGRRRAARRGRPRARASRSRQLEATGRPLLLDYAQQERGGPRVVARLPGWLVVVPFWAAWPFETLLIPTTPRRAPGGPRRRGARRARGRAPGPRPVATTRCSTGRSRTRWAGTRRRSARPVRPRRWQVHAHFYPPLLRASVRKFMVGYELLAEPQRDLTPEEAAERLRAAVPANRG